VTEVITVHLVDLVLWVKQLMQKRVIEVLMVFLVLPVYQDLLVHPVIKVVLVIKDYLVKIHMDHVVLTVFRVEVDIPAYLDPQVISVKQVHQVLPLKQVFKAFKDMVHQALKDTLADQVNLVHLVFLVFMDLKVMKVKQAAVDFVHLQSKVFKVIVVVKVIVDDQVNMVHPVFEVKKVIPDQLDNLDQLAYLDRKDFRAEMVIQVVQGVKVKRVI